MVRSGDGIGDFIDHAQQRGHEVAVLAQVTPNGDT